MRKIDDPIAIQIELKLRVPEIPNSMNCPETAGDVGCARLDWMKIASENIFGETIAVRVRTKAQPDVVSRDPIADHFILIALVKRKPDRVFADLVLLKAAVVRRLENEAVSAVASIAYEPIAAYDHVFRKHDRRASRILGECIVFKNICVRIHVMKPVTDVVDEIVFDARIVRKRKINAIPRVADLVAADQVSFTIPLVNSVAATVCSESGVAIFGALADSLFHRLNGIAKET